MRFETSNSKWHEAWVREELEGCKAEIKWAPLPAAASPTHISRILQYRASIPAVLTLPSRPPVPCRSSQTSAVPCVKNSLHTRADSACSGAARVEGLGWAPSRLGNSVHTYYFLCQRTHSRRRNVHKKLRFSKFVMHFQPFNPFTPESDQCQNSPAASQEIWHHTVWRTWLFIAYSDEKWLYYKFSLHHSYNRFLKGWENTLFELRSERVKGLKFYKWSGEHALGTP